MPPKDSLPPLDDLQRKIDAATPVPSDEGVSAGVGMGMRVGMELVAGVLVGAGAGYLLDNWLDTAPLFMIVCFFLGCGAGFLNMKRTVEQLDKADESAKTPRE